LSGSARADERALDAAPQALAGGRSSQLTPAIEKIDAFELLTAAQKNTPAIHDRV
jgi:hypothetical protein